MQFIKQFSRGEDSGGNGRDDVTGSGYYELVMDEEVNIITKQAQNHKLSH